MKNMTQLYRYPKQLSEPDLDPPCEISGTIQCPECEKMCFEVFRHFQIECYHCGAYFGIPKREYEMEYDYAS